MQLQKLNLDGTPVSVSDLPVQTNTQYLLTASTISAQDPGFHVVLGTHLTQAGGQVFNAFASRGVIVANNFPAEVVPG